MNPLIKIIEEKTKEFEKLFIKVTTEKEDDIPKVKIMQRLYDAIFQAEKKDFLTFHLSSLKAILEEMDKWAEENNEELPIKEHECHINCCGRCWCQEKDGIIKFSHLYLLIQDTIKSLEVN